MDSLGLVHEQSGSLGQGQPSWGVFTVSLNIGTDSPPLRHEESAAAATVQTRTISLLSVFTVSAGGQSGVDLGQFRPSTADSSCLVERQSGLV